jgi:hypothetical protein
VKRRKVSVLRLEDAPHPLVRLVGYAPFGASPPLFVRSCREPLLS